MSYTADSKSTRNANGSVTLRLTPEQNYYRDAAGAWQTVDLAPVAAAGGALRAKASPTAEMLGPASSGSVVSLDTTAGMLSISHPDATGAAAVSGARSTAVAAHSGVPPTVQYPNGLSKDRTLSESFIVNGVEESVSLPDAAAGPSYQIRLALPRGVKAVANASAVQLVDTSGKVVANLGGGLANDSATTPIDGAETPVSTAIVSQSAGGATLSVAISPTWLASPARVFPVVIDPDYITQEPNQDGCPDIADSTTAGSPFSSCETYVNSDNYYADPGYSNQTQLRSGSPGLTDEYVPSEANRTRSYVQFPIDEYGTSNYKVLSATFSLDTYGGSTSVGPTDVYGAAAYSGSLTNWSNQPGGMNPTSPGDGYGLVDQESFAGGQGYVNFNVTALAQRWFNGSEPDYGIEVLAANEFASSEFRLYYSGNAGASSAPALSIVYETPPQAPTSNQGSLSAGWYHSLAAQANGSVLAWGYNAYGELGNATTTNAATPQVVPGLSNVVAVAAGAFHSLALTSSGTVWAWGDNADGQLGNGSTTNALSPVQVTGLSAVVAISAGAYHSMALLSNGTVWAWGDNSNGQLGNNTTTNSTVPVEVQDLSAVAAISAGYTDSVALTTADSIYDWGSNASGQLGNGTTTDAHVPEALPGLGGDFDSIAAGADHTLGTVADSDVLAWGANNYGQLGNGTTTASLTPTKVSVLPYASAVNANSGSEDSFALDDAALYAWGYNAEGQLGNGTTTNVTTPTQIILPGGEATGASAGLYHSLAYTFSGTVSSWGYNAFGELGNGTTTSSSTPEAVTALSFPESSDTLVATAGANSVATTWAPGPDGGAVISSYTSTLYQGVPGSGSYVAAQSCNECTSASFTGLIGGSEYYVTVTASNSMGTGPPASSNGVTTTGTPPTTTTTMPTTTTTTMPTTTTTTMPTTTTTTMPTTTTTTMPPTTTTTTMPPTTTTTTMPPTTTTTTMPTTTTTTMPTTTTTTMPTTTTTTMPTTTTTTVPPPPGTLPGTVSGIPTNVNGIDTDDQISLSDAQQAATAGKQFAIRYVSLETGEQPGDLTHSEALDILNSGLGLMVSQHVLDPGWMPTAALGTTYGTSAAANSASIGLPMGTNVFLDLEGIATTGVTTQQIIDYANDWSAAVSAGGYSPGIYVGYDTFLTADQLASLNFQHYWESESTVPSPTGRGYQLIQSAASPAYGLTNVDNDVAQTDQMGGMAQWDRES